jgi:hypothetical protein
VITSSLTPLLCPLDTLEQEGAAAGAPPQFVRSELCPSAAQAEQPSAGEAYDRSPYDVVVCGGDDFISLDGGRCVFMLIMNQLPCSRPGLLMMMSTQPDIHASQTRTNFRCFPKLRFIPSGGVALVG